VIGAEEVVLPRIVDEGRLLLALLNG